VTSFNPLQIAILRWYPANQPLPDIPVPGRPFGIACDGANIWVTNFSDNSVSRR